MKIKLLPELKNFGITSLPIIFKVVLCWHDKVKIIINSLDLSYFSITLFMLSLSSISTYIYKSESKDSQPTQNEKDNKYTDLMKVIKYITVLFVFIDCAILGHDLLKKDITNSPGDWLCWLFFSLSVVSYFFIGYFSKTSNE